MEPSHSAESREYLTPYSVQQHRDGRYSTEPSPTSQQYLQHHGPHSHLSPELGRPSNMSPTSSPHYSNNVGTSIQSYSHLEAQNHGHVSYPHSAPGTPLPHTPLPLPSSHSSGYLDAFSDVPMHSVMGMEMDPTLGIDLRVLSSERHRDYRILEERQRPRPNTLATEATRIGRTQRATSTESADSAKREKNGGATKSGGGKKARGRPRLDTTDENAADRRRTQIRLAQRAYRMRKETTITSLRTRVEELEKTIDKMQNLFYELHDAAMNPELNGQDTYRESISQLADRFQTLQAATAGAFVSEEAGDSHHEEEGEQQNQHKRERIPSSRDIPTLAKRRSHDSDDGSGPNDASKGIGFGMANFTMQLTTSRGKTTSRFGSNYSSGSGSGSYSGKSSVVSTYQNARSGDYPSSQTTTTTTTVSEATKSLQLRDDFSFSLRDASFSKRLHRAALEHAFGLLTSPAVDQTATDRVFAYSFCYKSKDDIIKSIATILNSPTGSPPVDASTFRTLDSESHSETLRKEAYKQFVQLGIYQKYLRPDDVERILIESGVLTAPEPTFHSDMDTIDYQEDSDGQQSPCSSDKFCYSADGRFDSAEPDEAKIFGQHSNPATEDELRPSTFPIKLIQGIRNPIIEDVLITELIKRGVCLGQFPGFKMAAVEEAVKIAAEQGSTTMSPSVPVMPSMEVY